MTAELVLIRGLPGSGKSTMAREFAGRGYAHREADMWFEQRGHDFQPFLLTHAHKWCRESAANLLFQGRSVVVSNTFARLWEMQDYIDMARAHGVPIRVLTATGDFQNIHGVPDDKIEEMRARWEPLEDGLVLGDLAESPRLAPVR